MGKLLLKRFLVFWGNVTLSALVFAATATILHAFKVPLVWQFWIALGVGAAYMVILFWLSFRFGLQGKGE